MDQKPWERQSGETAQQFARFNAYLYLPAGERNINQAYRQFRFGSLGLDKPNFLRKAPNCWYALAEKHKWEARATAKDEDTQSKLLQRAERAEIEHQTKLREQKYAAHDLLIEDLHYTRAEIRKIGAMPVVSINEKKYHTDGSLESERKIGRAPRSEMAQLFKTLMELHLATQFGLNPAKPETVKADSDKPQSPATHLELIIEPHADADEKPESE